MITKKTKYALKALINLAREYGNGPVLISELSREERIPKKFLELILLALKNNGILNSKKGKGGGYYLLKTPEQVSMGEIVRMMDGPLAPVSCVSETAYAPCTECDDEQLCGIRIVMKRVRDSIADILDGTSLADLLVTMQTARKQKEDAIDYHI